MATLSATSKGDARRAHILDSARAAFLRDGFHATSMQDLFAEAQTSPGAFYRYFPSKDALVSALAGEAIGLLAKSVGAAMDSQPRHVADALRPAIFAIDDLERDKGGARLALMIWSEAQRSRELAALVGEAIRPMLEALGRLAAALLARGIVPGASYAPEDLAVVLGGLLQGYVVQRALFGVRPEIYETGLAAITRRHG